MGSVDINANAPDVRASAAHQGSSGANGPPRMRLVRTPEACKRSCMPLFLAQRAQKQLEGLPKTDAQRLLKRLKYVAAAPAQRHAGLVALIGEAAAIRVRRGDWRAICSFEYDLVVRRIAHQREACR